MTQQTDLAVKLGIVPAAVHKAASLARFAQGQGSPLATFAVALTEPEAYELLEYIAGGHLVQVENQELLLADIEEAKAKRDPWLVLQHFHLSGLDIARAKDLN